MLSQAVTCERAAGHPPMWRLMGASPLLPLPTFNLVQRMGDASEHRQSLRMRLRVAFYKQILLTAGPNAARKRSYWV